jgi:3-hydroxy acid dehydrogenase/malonic semialdehyde reductase
MALDISNKIVLITGASSGIGKSSAFYFAQAGCKLILTARRIARLKEIAQDITNKYNVEVLALELDVQNRNQVQSLLDGLDSNWCDIDILVNNAGLAAGTDKIQDGNVDGWDTVIDTNIKGLLYVTKAILPNMVKRNSGHIINISSIAGHEYYPGGNIYSATKHAVKAINKSLRIDLLGSAIRVSEVAPGLVHTEFSEVRWHDRDRAEKFYAGLVPLQADDVADAVVYCATRPLHVDVETIVIMPTVQASTNHVALKDGSGGSVFD